MSAIATSREPEDTMAADLSDDEHAVPTGTRLRLIRTVAPGSGWTPPAKVPEVPKPFAPPLYWQCLDLADLHAWNCAPLEPLVENIIARGNYVNISAASQTGKTLLSLYLVQKLLHGGNLFDKYRVTPVKKVLYLVLEDPDRRIHERLLDTAHEFPDQVAHDRCLFQLAPGFDLANEAMWKWFKDQIDKHHPDVVVIDTYQKATPGLESFNDKEQTPILHKLANLTREYATQEYTLTLIVIDHIRKAQASARGKKPAELTLSDTKGSGAKVQNADCVILLARSPDGTDLHFQVLNKDFDEHVRIVLRVAPQGSLGEKFTYLGEMDAGRNRASKDRTPKSTGRRDQVRSIFPTAPDWLSTPAAATRFNEHNEHVSASTIKGDVRTLVAQRHLRHNGKEGRHRAYQRIDNLPDERPELPIDDRP